MKVICISGKAQHGKDTVAVMLKNRLETHEYKVLIIHYADLLKHICRSFFGWDDNKDDKGRHLLQFVGTDVIRKQKPDFWVDFVTEILTLFPDTWDYVIVPDCRFPNELQRLSDLGFDVTHLRVIRESFVSPLTYEQQMHPSETALDLVAPNYYIHNKGSVSDLDETVSDWVIKQTGYYQMSLDELGQGRCVG